MTESKKYTRDIVVRITGDNDQNVYWECVGIENRLKPLLTGNTFAFLTPTYDTLTIRKETEA